MTSLAPQSRREIRTPWVSFLVILTSLFTFQSHAQNGSPCYKPLIGPGTTATPVGGSVVQIGFTTGNGIDNLTDGNTANYAEIANLLTVASNQGVSVADANNTYPAGFYAGYVVDLGSNGLLSARILEGIQVQTYNNGVLAETRTFSSGLGVTLLSDGSPGKVYLSFKTAQPFDEVRLIRGTLANLTVANSLKIYYATAFDPACGTLDNNGICEDQIAGNQTVVNFNPGVLNALADLDDPENITDGDRDSYAILTLPVGSNLTSAPPFVGVKSLQTIYPAGGRVGFVIQQAGSILAANVLSRLRIQTYLHGELQQNVPLDDNAVLVGATLLGGTDPAQKVSIATTLPYNEVRLVVAQNASINVGTLRIYYAFESGASCTDCNDLLTETRAYPDASTVGSRTGGGVCGLATVSVNNAGRVTDADTTNFARINFTGAVGIGCEGSISVRTTSASPFTAIPANAFAGFVISKNANTLADLALLGGLRIRTYRNGNLVDDSDNAGISLVGLSLLAGGDARTKVGIRTTAPFDEIRITADFGLLGTFLTTDDIRVYYAFVQRDDDNDGVLDCNEICGTSQDDSVDSDGDGTPDACETCNATNNKSATIDTDSDGLFNNCDPDSDNDGIPDAVEDTNNDGDPNNDDQDGDGVPNYLDLDSDNDGILDLYESGINGGQIASNDSPANGVLDSPNALSTNTPKDTDGDGVPDFLDLDSDNDGIKDLTEIGITGATDANNDGVVDGPDADNDGVQDSVDGNDGAFGSPGFSTPRDTDGDGVPNVNDLDSDNDGIKDLTESGITGATDANNDGVVDGPDADGDGVRDSVDSDDDVFGSPGVILLTDTDSDTVPNYLDLDSDNDGIKDLYESGQTGFADADGNGVLDTGAGTDNDNDGIQNSVDTEDGTFGSPGGPALRDTDSDTVPNYLDLDSDNDGIKDLYESGLPNPGSLDTDGNGVIDTGADNDQDGIQDSVDEQDNAFGSDDLAAPVDTDGDGVPDVNDLDSDNDGINDIVENANPAVVDADNNGLVDGADNDKDGILGGADTNDGVFGSPGSPVPDNSDNDDSPNFQDLDSDNDTVSDLVESGQTGYTDTPEDGVVDGPDSDGDGIQNSVDEFNGFGDANSPTPQDTDPGNNDGPDYIDTDSDGDNTDDIDENGNSSLDPDNDGMIDDTTDDDNDGIADVVDEKDDEFGGLSQDAGIPDLTPSVFANGGTYNTNEQKDVVIAIFNVGPDATTGPVTFEVNKLTPSFTIAIDPNATTSSVTTQPTVNNSEWTFTEEFTRYLVTLKDGFTIPAGGNKKIVIRVSATNNPNAAATITARVFNGTGGGETPTTNNSAVYLISINNSNN